MNRTAYLASLIGQSWEAAGRCYGLARTVEADLFGRSLPEVSIPDDLSWKWMIDTIERHPERDHWREVPEQGGIICAADGALVLMARADRPAHIGIWLRPEGGVLHADQNVGVIFESPAQLRRVRGWGRLRFYEPQVS